MDPGQSRAWRWLEGGSTTPEEEGLVLDLDQDTLDLDELMLSQKKEEQKPEEAGASYVENDQASTVGSEDFDSLNWLDGPSGKTGYCGQGGVWVPRYAPYNPPRSRDRSDCTGTVGKPLLETFTKLVKQFPLGISVDMFVAKFKTQHGYHPEISNFGYGNFIELVCDYPDYFWALKSPLKEPLMFHVNYKGTYTTTMELFLKVWENIELLLVKNGYILKLAEIPALLGELGCQANPGDWSLIKDKYYSHMCRRLKKYTNSDKTIFIEKSLEDDSFMVLIQVEDSVEQTLKYNRRRAERLKQEEKEHKYLDTKIKYEKILNSGEFVRHQDAIGTVLDVINEGDCHACLGGAIFSPGHFYVNIIYYWNALEDMMRNMQIKYKALERNLFKNKAIAWEEHLTPGFLVAVRAKQDREWHRARIVRQTSDKLFKVFFIDYGDIVDVDIMDIRYLLTTFRSLRAQAVRCVSQMGKYYNRACVTMFNKNLGWNENETPIFREIIFDKDLAVQFKRKTEVDDEAGYEVFVHILAEKESKDGKIALHHAEREVLRRSRKPGYVCYANEDTECNEKLHMNTFDRLD